MTGTQREWLRALIDQVRRERLCAGLGGDPTKTRRCLHCGHPFRVPPFGSEKSDFCSQGCRVTWVQRRSRLTRIMETTRV